MLSNRQSKQPSGCQQSSYLVSVNFFNNPLTFASCFFVSSQSTSKRTLSQLPSLASCGRNSLATTNSISSSPSKSTAYPFSYRSTTAFTASPPLFLPAQGYYSCIYRHVHVRAHLHVRITRRMCADILQSNYTIARGGVNIPGGFVAG